MPPESVSNLRAKTISYKSAPTPKFLISRHLAAHSIAPRDLEAGLTEALLARLPPPPAGVSNYSIADRGRRGVPGLRVHRGKAAITFTLGAAIKRPDGRFKSVAVTLGRWGSDGLGMSLKAARSAALAKKEEYRKSVHAQTKYEQEPNAKEAITLRIAWELYKSARTQPKKKRRPLAPSTLEGYTRIIEVALREFVDTPLEDLAEDPRPLIAHFDRTTLRTPSEANGQMRVVRAVWNRAHKTLPKKVPAPPHIFDLNEVEPRDAGFVTREVKHVWAEISALAPMARKGAFVFLLTGLREGAVLSLKGDQIDHDDKTVTVHSKGKLLRLPLSEVTYSLLVAKTPENLALPDNPYLFPSVRGPRPRHSAAIVPGYVNLHVDHLDFKAMTPPAAYVAQRGEAARVHPHVFRHTYRTLATSAYVSEIAIRLLMGHSLSGDVSFDYLTADLTWLRKAQEQISAYILEAAGLDAGFRFPPDAFSQNASKSS